MLPWLMRLGPAAARLGPRLFRGTGWGKKARGTSTVRPPTVAPYTPVGRRFRGTKGKYEPVTPPTGTPPYTPLYTNPATIARQPPGWARQHPYKAGVAGTLGAGVGAFTGYGLMAGDEEPPIDPNLMTTPTDPWSAPEDMMSFAESEIARVEEGEQNFRKLMDYGMLIAATGGNAEKFFERGKWVLEQSDQYAQDKQYAKAVRAVYKEGDMPKSAREAYERLTPLMGPEKAAVLSGHQLGMETGKTKEERAWNEIMAVAQMGDLDGAAAALVAAWNSGRLKNPATHITIYSAQLKKARETLAGVMSGGAGYAEGVTDIALREASA